eukprot:7142887-Pyramimonas_sp.AAC.1
MVEIVPNIMSEEPIRSPMDLSEVNHQIEMAQKKPAPFSGSAPKFVRVPGTNGCISLWHFPSANQMMQAKEVGCTDVVTLQNSSEKIESVQRYVAVGGNSRGCRHPVLAS